MTPKALLTIVATAVLAVASSSAACQTPPVQGTLYESGSERTIAMAAVYLLRDGVAEDVALTDERGWFRLTARGSGSYRLQVDRIGFESELSESFDVPATGVTGLSMTLQVRPVELAELSVRAGRICNIDAARDSELLRVWLETRKALATTMLGAQTGTAQFRVEITERRLGRDLDVERAEADTMIVGGDHGFDFAPMEELERDGWGRLENGVMTRFYGPSPESLLSTWFGANHCLGLSEEVDADSNIGLTFESVDDSLAIGIEGVFWINPSNWHLRSIAFRFKGSRDLERARGQGGIIHLEVDPLLGWYVREWRMRSPILAAGALEWSGVGGRVMTATRRYRLSGYQERHGRVIGRK